MKVDKTKRAADLIAQIAKKHNVTEECVKKEIERAIHKAYQNEKSRYKWDAIFGENVIPTVEEFLTKMGQILSQDK